MRRTHARQTARNDLAGFGNEPRKQAHVLVVDAVNFLGAELANLLAAEEFPPAFAGTARAAARPSGRDVVRGVDRPRYAEGRRDARWPRPWWRRQSPGPLF